MDDGVFTFLAAVAGSNAVSSFLDRIDIDGVKVVASLRDARLRNSDRLAPVMPRNDFASRRIGAV